MARSFKIKLLLLVAISGSSLHCEQILYDQTIINIAGYSLLTSVGIGALTGCVQGLKGTKAPVLACEAASASSAAVVAALLIKIITKTDVFKEDLKFVIEHNLDDVKYSNVKTK